MTKQADTETDDVNSSRRRAMLGMAKALAYVPPVVATFALTTWSSREAQAYLPPP